MVGYHTFLISQFFETTLFVQSHFFENHTFSKMHYLKLLFLFRDQHYKGKAAAHFLNQLDIDAMVRSLISQFLFSTWCRL